MVDVVLRRQEQIQRLCNILLSEKREEDAYGADGGAAKDPAAKDERPKAGPPPDPLPGPIA